MADNNKKITKKMDTYSVKNALVNYFLVAIFTIFPLFFTNQYAKIRHDKLYFFLVAGILLIVAESIILPFSIYENNLEKIKKKRWYKNLSVTDFAFGGLMISYIFSTALSVAPLDALSGTQGRNNGLFLMAVYFGVYIVLSRLFVYKEYVFTLFAVSSIVVYILCVLNFFYIDPLGIFRNYSDQVIMDFTSTIGNKNLMASFCCVTIPVFFMMFMHQKNLLRYLYLIASGIGFSALICANSECGFLGLIPTLAIIFIYSTKSYLRLLNFFVTLAVMLGFGRIVGYLHLIFPKNKNLSTIQSFFASNNVVYVGFLLCIAVSLILYFLIRNKDIPSAIFYISLTLGILSVFAVAFLMIYFTFIDTTTKLGAVTSYFRFGEKWGTHRGYMWIKSFEIFAKSSFKDKIFGCGPDTFYTAFAPYFGELNAKYGNTSTNTAHNEFINYLVTIGIAGLISYITIVISIIFRAFKASKKNYVTVVFAMGIICYLFQSTVNIAQPITTPYLFIFVAITEALCKSEKNKATD